MLHTLPSLRSILIPAVLTAFVAGSFPALRADDAASPLKKTTGESTTGKTGTDKAPPAKDTVEGTLTINEVSVKLTHIVIYEAKFFDELRINVFASSEPIPLEKLTDSLKKDGTDDDFFLFEPNVKLTFDEKGKLASFNAWADNTTVARSGGDDLTGKIETKEGRVTGSASNKSKEDDTFKCDFDIKFSGNLMKAPKIEDKPKSGKSKSGKSTKKKPSSLLDFLGGGKPKSDDDEPSAKDDDGDEEEMKEEEEEDDDEDESPKKKKSSDKSPNVYDLPLPKDAKNVEYKKIVNMVDFKSATGVEDLADFIVKGLEKQGWSSENDSDLITPNSCIIKREQGDAELTIFVKPDGQGSKVTIMSEGLSWEKKKKPAEEKSAPSKKAPLKTDDDSAESEKEE